MTACHLQAALGSLLALPPFSVSTPFPASKASSWVVLLFPYLCPTPALPYPSSLSHSLSWTHSCSCGRICLPAARWHPGRDGQPLPCPPAAGLHTRRAAMPSPQKGYPSLHICSPALRAAGILPPPSRGLTPSLKSTPIVLDGPSRSPGPTHLSACTLCPAEELPTKPVPSIMLWIQCSPTVQRHLSGVPSPCPPPAF